MIAGVLLKSIADILSIVLNLYMWIVIISALISWVQPNPYNPIVVILRRLTEPVFRAISKRIPTTIAGFDFAPIIVLLAIYFLNSFAVELLRIYAASLTSKVG